MAGASCAYHLALDGHRVTLIERGGLASGTSGAGQNNIGVPLGAGEALAYFLAAFETYRELLGAGFDFGFHRHGHLYVALDREVADRARLAAVQLRDAGVAVRLLGHRELEAAEPRLARTVEASVLLPDGAQVSPVQTVHELAAAATRLGARMVTGTTVTGITVRRGRFNSIETSAGRFDADGMVIAAGVWSRELGALAGVNVPVLPRKGQLLVSEAAPGWMTHSVLDFGFDLALMAGTSQATHGPIVGTVIQPLPSGNILVGGSYEDGGLDRTVDRDVVGRIAREAVRIMPDIASLQIVRTWAGLRPATADGWPLVGAVSRIRGLMLATGHGSGGIDGGPLAGHLIADLVAGRRIPAGLGALDPARLGDALYASSPGYAAPSTDVAG
jgi:glycine/D-amino acid oxidase-like deaminating enzyme